MTEPRTRPIINNELTEALMKSGVLPPNCRRYIIDSGYPTDTITMYYECLGDQRLLDVVLRIGPALAEKEDESPETPQHGEQEDSKRTR